MKRPDPSRRLAEAALRLAGREGWGAVTLPVVARAARVPLAEARRLFPDAPSLIPAMVARITEQAEESRTAFPSSVTFRERLFDAFMARLDALQAARPGILAVVRAARRDPACLAALLRALRPALEATFSGANPPAGLRRLPGILLLPAYAALVRSWVNDTTPDLAPTTARLDRWLGRLEKIAG